MALRKVAGVPLILRGMFTLARSGVKRITLLVAEPQRRRIEQFLTRYRPERLPAIDIIAYDEPYRVSPETVAAIAARMAKRFLLINADLLFEGALVTRMQEETARADRDLVICRSGAHPLPFYSVALADWRALAAFTEERPRSIQSCLHHLLESPHCRFFQKPPAIGTFLVSHLKDRAVAEKFLAEQIRHAIDAPVAKYINKRISLPISLVLSKLWVSPHAITVVNILIGLFSGVFIADGFRYSVILIGAVLFQTASIVDGCDGEVAKLTFRCSKFGQYIDSLSDNLTLGSLYAGLIAGYWRQTHSPVAFLVGAIMLAGTGITLFWIIRFLKRKTDSASLVTFDKQYLQHLRGEPRWLLTFIRYSKYTVKKDVYSFCVLGFAIAGVLYWWLFITAFGAALSAAILTYLNVKPMLARSRKTAPARTPVAADPEGGSA